MPGGRPPKPTQLKVLQGNPGRRPLPKGEPQPAVKALPCPRWLLPEARREWRRMAKVLARLRVLTEADRAAFEGYCQSYARWREAEERVTAEGAVMSFEKEGGGTYAQPSPWVTIAKAEKEAMRRFLGEFGMTPSSRTKVATAASEQKDPFEEFMRGSRGAG